MSDADDWKFLSAPANGPTPTDRTWTCWSCGAETKADPHDADGTGTTGMMWPSYCLTCCEDANMDLPPVSVSTFRERFPYVEVPIEPVSEMARTNQAAYRMMARRGGWKSVMKA